jgi:enoyl-CoA hydratase
VSAQPAVRWTERNLDGGLVCTAELCALGPLNLVDRAWLESAAAELGELLSRPALRCLLLRGVTPRAFIGGADLTALGALDLATAEPFIRAVHGVCSVLREAAVPVVGILRGHCLGAGLEIACACDLRIGDDSVRCGMPEVRVGVPSVVEAALLPGLVGWGKARELMLRGHLVDAAEADRIGLLQARCAPEGLDALADTVARDLVAGQPVALAKQKRLFRAWEESFVGAAVEHGIAAFVSAYQGDEPARAVAAFFARRAAAKAAADVPASTAFAPPRDGHGR